LKFYGLDWDEESEEHLWQHGVKAKHADEVFYGGLAVFLRNKKGRRGSIRMVGPDRGGAMWTVVLAGTRRQGFWRPVTGWPSTKGECALYERGRS
jgi:uncharacterized DUF497 family protein